MVTSFRRISFLALAISVFFGAVSSHAQNQSAGTAPITTVVTALGPKYTAPPPISQSDVSVYSGKDKQNVTAWVPAQGDKANLELAIVIDDSDRIDIGIRSATSTVLSKASPNPAALQFFMRATAPCRPRRSSVQTTKP